MKHLHSLFNCVSHSISRSLYFQCAVHLCKCNEFVSMVLMTFWCVRQRRWWRQKCGHTINDQYCLYALQMRTTFKFATETWIWLIQQLFYLIVCQCHITIIVRHKDLTLSFSLHTTIAQTAIHLMWVNPFFAVLLLLLQQPYQQIHEIYWRRAFQRIVCMWLWVCVMQNPHSVIKQREWRREREGDREREAEYKWKWCAQEPITKTSVLIKLDYL